MKSIKKNLKKTRLSFSGTHDLDSAFNGDSQANSNGSHSSADSLSSLTSSLKQTLSFATMGGGGGVSRKSSSYSASKKAKSEDPMITMKPPQTQTQINKAIVQLKSKIEKVKKKREEATKIRLMNERKVGFVKGKILKLQVRARVELNQTDLTKNIRTNRNTKTHTHHLHHRSRKIESAGERVKESLLLLAPL